MGSPKVCPYCGQAITSAKIARRIAKAEAAQLRELKREYETRLEQERERALAKAERKMERAFADLEEQLKKKELTLESAMEEAEERAREHETELERIRKEAGADARKEVKRDFEQRLEEKDEELEREREEAEKDKRRLLKQVEDLQRRLEKKTTEAIGRIPEEDLERTLLREFPDDTIVRLAKGRAGGDLIQTVVDSGGEAGKIVYEVKNTLKWNNAFVDQARKHRTTYGTPHVILVTRVFPAKEEGFAERDGILIVGADKAIVVARLLRQSIVALARERRAGVEVDTKTAELYSYLRSPDFRERIRAIFGGVERLRKLQDQERRTHEKMWNKEVKEHRTLHDHTSNVEGKVSAIVEGRVIHIPVPRPAKRKRRR